MNKFMLTISLDDFKGPFAALFSVIFLTAAFLWIGRDVASTPVISLLYLVPITWFTIRWGQLSGIAAAITATLAFDFYFIPPYGTFNIGSLEGWLILIIFLMVSVVVVGQIQTVLNQARLSEREAIIMYELVSSLTTLHSREAIARTLANSIQQDFQAKQVSVSLYKTDNAPNFKINAPENSTLQGRPSRVLVIDNRQKIAGDISIWKGELPLPAEKNWLVQSFTRQTALALERVENYSIGKTSAAVNDADLIGKQS